VQNPLHGVERAEERAIAFMAVAYPNPLHGVERQVVFVA
jgi:hypothetical protein